MMKNCKHFTDADDSDFGWSGSPKEVFGWIVSEEFIPTSQYDHVDAIAKSQALKNLIPNYQLIAAKLDDIKRGCESGPAYSAEWHVYEMACADAGSEMVEMLYNAGAIRVGSWEGTVHFEGTSAGLARSHAFCKEFASNLDMDSAFEPRKEKIAPVAPARVVRRPRPTSAFDPPKEKR